MSTNIRPEISKKGRYYVSKERYYELKHFCLQYREWLTELEEIGYLPELEMKEIHTTSIAKSVEIIAERRIRLTNRIHILNEAVRELNDPIGCFIFDSVTTGRAFPYYEANELVYGRDYWYERYRKFFYILDNLRE